MNEVTTGLPPDLSNFSSENGSICEYISFDAFSESCKLWIQGVLLLVVGTFGIIGNLVSIIVLSRPEISSVFNMLLAIMTSFDTIYIVLSIAEFSFVSAFSWTWWVYDTLFVYFLYPIHNIALCCSVYGHVVLAVERYLAVCHPELVYSTMQRNNNNRRRRRGHHPEVRRKVMIYIIPVIATSIIINIPRWFELEMKVYSNISSDNSTVAAEEITGIEGTWLRYDENYVNFYLNWTLLLFTGIIPLISLAFLNTRIYLRIKEVQKIRTTTHTRNEPNFGATLASIIIIFIICHLPRVIKNIYEIIVTNQLIASGETCNGMNPAKCLVHINNFLLTLNASGNFLVYCFVGSFGTQFLDILKRCCFESSSTPRFKNNIGGEGRTMHLEEGAIFNRKNSGTFNFNVHDYKNKALNLHRENSIGDTYV